MYLMSHDPRECTGCGACVNRCPQQCIAMKEDADGFRFPEIDASRCLSCHLCETVCPVEHPPIPETSMEPEMAAAFVSDEELLLKSASGGAFTRIVQWFTGNGEGYVWGAAYTDGLQVRHICSRNGEALELLRGSKYVMSDAGDCYRRITDQLREGSRVLFSGTPCQVAALRNFLRYEKTENLFCVDLVCHGAPSQKLFDTYLSEESARLGSRVIGVKFRYKRHLLPGKWSTRNLLMKTESGRMVVRTRFRCDYLRAYHPCLMNRESCYECVFSRPERCGDLTIGDFWGIERFDKKLDVEHGVSILQANTEKGKMILSSLKESMAYYPVEWERYRKTFGNSLAKAGGIPMNPKRVAFLQSVREKGFHRAVRAIYPLHRDAVLFRIGTIKKKVKTMIRKEQGIRS